MRAVSGTEQLFTKVTSASSLLLATSQASVFAFGNRLRDTDRQRDRETERQRDRETEAPCLKAANPVTKLRYNIHDSTLEAECKEADNVNA